MVLANVTGVTTGSRSASLPWPGRRRGWYPIQIVLLWLTLAACVSFRAHLTHPQLAQHLIDPLSELAGQIGTRVVVCHGGHVNQQSGVSAPQFELGGIKQAEQYIRDNLVDGKRTHSPRVLAGVLHSRCLFLLGAFARAGSAHDSLHTIQRPAS
jgi:hypothetical protein